MDERVDEVALDEMPGWMRDVVERIVEPVDGTQRVEVKRLLGSSNETLELNLGADRVLMVKRGRHDWTRRMFRTAAAASELIREATELAAPRPLTLGPSSPEPLQAYWRIPLPTLGDLWPALDSAARRAALRSLGQLLRETHAVRAPGWGDLLEPERGDRALELYLHQDLGQRLLPAVYGCWSEAAAPLEGLIDAIPAAAGRARDEEAVLSHSDVHIENVLCRKVDGVVRCVGLLDLDNARALPSEADIASFQVLHGPLFNQRLEDREKEAMLEGYGAALDDFLLRFFRASHLANLGFHSALVGDDIHAGWVADAFRAEVDALHGLPE